MKHKIGYNRLGRRQAHRKAMKNNMVTSLFRYERVETTKAKALEVKRSAEKLVTRARVDSVHNRRVVAEKIQDKEVLAKLFTEIAPRYVGRPGGYTRMLKTHFRQGDAAQMVILELVDRKIEEKVRPERESARETREEETAEVEAAEGTQEVVSEDAVTEEAPADVETAPASEDAVEEPADEAPDAQAESEDSTEEGDRADQAQPAADQEREDTDKKPE